MTKQEDMKAPELTDTEAIEVWLQTEVAAAYKKLKADPSIALTPEQVCAFLAETRKRKEGRGQHSSGVPARNSRKLLLALRVLNAAKEIFGEEELPITWLVNKQLSGFNQKTAWELIEAGRTEDVLQYLKSYSAGFVG